MHANTSYHQLFQASKQVDLNKIKTEVTLHTVSSDVKEVEKLQLASLTQKIAEYQNILYASKQYKVLVILQGMDTSGKDGTIRSVFGEMNALGTRAVAFKAPNNHEMAHDYLWRVHQQVPGAGEIVLFNRSHYEDVLVTRAHDWIDQAECERRYAHIRDFERLLSETGTVIFKFFLHISAEEQKKRLTERINDPKKQWKYDPQDLIERRNWHRYQTLYAAAIEATNSEAAPWYIVPSDSKMKRNLIIAQIMVEQLENLKLHYPAPRPELKQIEIS